MNENSRLRPQAIKHQCDAAVDVLEKDNEALRTVGKSLDQFVADNELESQSFGELKEHMEDYRLVLNSMTAANNEDIADYNYLKSHVGSEDIDGVVVLAQMDKAEEGFNSAERLAEKYRRMSYSTSYDLVTAQSMRTQAQMYECSAALWRQIYDCWKQKEETYDRIESSTASLFTAGPLMRADIRSALETFGVSGKYQTKGNPLWRQKLQDGEISETRRELLKMGVTKQQLQHMEEIGYLPKEVKAILESCETEEDRIFFSYLMEGTAESYIKAFAVNPYSLSEDMSIVMADYACHLLEPDESGQSTNQSADQLMKFSNAILRAEEFEYNQPGYDKLFRYRDIYLEKLYAGIETLLLSDIKLLSLIEPPEESGGILHENYVKMCAEYNKKLILKNFVGTQQEIIAQLDKMTGEDQFCRIKELSYSSKLLHFSFEHFSPDAAGGIATDSVECSLALNGTHMDNYKDLQHLNSLGNKVQKIQQDLYIEAIKKGFQLVFKKANPGLGLAIDIIYGVTEIAATTDDLIRTKKTVKKEDEITIEKNPANLAEMIFNSCLRFINKPGDMSKEEWDKYQKWFGMGGRYELEKANGNSKDGYAFIGNYDADVIRTMMKWECGGLSAWLPADALGVEETMEKDGLRVMKSDEEIQEEKQRKIDAAVLEIKKVTDLSNAEIENCCNLLLGKPGMFDDMTMSEFLTAVQNIEELDMMGELDIRAEFYVAVNSRTKLC